MPGPRKFYITTPIYYPSDNLHIGHAYTTVAADSIARYKRLRGYDVLFVTGTDEHGQKIQRKAAEKGVTPREFVDPIVENIKALWRLLGISNDDFIRTTEERHIRVVQEVFRRIQENGDIYKAEYEGWYCVPCETFWLERQLKDGCCPNPDCGRPVELVREESYFFKLSKYQEPLLRYIEENPDFIQPASRRNEMLSFIKGGLEDLCVSRTTFNWGIPVPGDPNHVIYVWFDALTNYITAAGYAQDPDKFNYWWPADVHLVGKEIVRFHTVIWPITLLALGVPLPKKVFGHGWLVLEGGKMSKSKGNVVDPVKLVEKYGVDAVRYFLLREIPFGADGRYSEEALVQRINADLANDLGNLVHRTHALVRRRLEGRVPRGMEELEPVQREALRETPCWRWHRELGELVSQCVGEYEQCMEALQLSAALGAVWKVVARCNKLIDESAPWSLLNQGESGAVSASVIIRDILESAYVVAILLSPFLIQTPAKMLAQLGAGENPEIRWEDVSRWGRCLKPGAPLSEPEVLFPRVETGA